MALGALLAAGALLVLRPARGLSVAGPAQPPGPGDVPPGVADWAGRQAKAKRPPPAQEEEDPDLRSDLEVRTSRMEVRGFLAFGGPPRRHGCTQREKLVRLDPGRHPGTDFERIWGREQEGFLKAGASLKPPGGF